MSGFPRSLDFHIIYAHGQLWLDSSGKLNSAMPQRLMEWVEPKSAAPRWWLGPFREPTTNILRQSRLERRNSFILSLTWNTFRPMTVLRVLVAWWSCVWMKSKKGWSSVVARNTRDVTTPRHLSLYTHVDVCWAWSSRCQSGGTRIEENMPDTA